MTATQQGICGVAELHPQMPLRSPNTVMRLQRMGSFFPSRLSFMRSLLRDLADRGASVKVTAWELDDAGFGHAVYTVGVDDRSYSLVCFSTELDPANRTDRVIAEAWDASFVLYDGVPDDAEIERLRRAAPTQEAARYAATDLVLSRANRSVRLFDFVVDSLAGGHQPDAALLGEVGYLMRTTAVYGNGKFGIADRERIADRAVLNGPFRAEMLTVWLIRAFTHDLVSHIAARRSPATAVPLADGLRRSLGIGNSTGLGMAPFLVNHPELLNNWMLARETALARVRAVPTASPHELGRFAELVKRAKRHVEQWRVDDRDQTARIATLGQELVELSDLTAGDYLEARNPWDRLMELAERWSSECVELIVSALLECHPSLVDGLADCMSALERRRIDTRQSVGDALDSIEANYGWALDVDYSSADNSHYFWYTSEEKLEPRLGERYSEPGAEREAALDVGRRVAALHVGLKHADRAQRLSEFLMTSPQHRFALQRVQISQSHPYSEIRDNLIAADCRPIDMLRCKLSFFGAARCDPRSDRWTRVSLFQGAPLLGDLVGGDLEAIDDWWMPANP